MKFMVEWWFAVGHVTVLCIVARVASYWPPLIPIDYTLKAYKHSSLKPHIETLCFHGN